MKMAEVFGADVRLGSQMQYLRVLLVGIAATTVARLWVPVSAHVPRHLAAFLEALASGGRALRDGDAVGPLHRRRLPRAGAGAPDQ